MSIPDCLGLIPDASRTWAIENGKSMLFGHTKGLQNAEQIMRYAFDAGVKTFVFWGASEENLRKRSRKQVEHLFRLFKKELRRRKKKGDEGIRLVVCGRWEEFRKDPTLRKLIDEAEERTKNNKRGTLIVLFGYSGQSDILHAAKTLQRSKEEVTEESFHRNLISSPVPKVDLIIRTGGNRHSSEAFLAWQAANAEWYVSEKKWPEFGKEDLHAAFAYYASRPRKCGA